MARYRARPFDNCGQKIDKSVQSSPRTECRLDSGLARENRLKPAICLTLWRRRLVGLNLRFDDIAETIPQEPSGSRSSCTVSIFDVLSFAGHGA